MLCTNTRTLVIRQEAARGHATVEGTVVLYSPCAPSDLAKETQHLRDMVAESHEVAKEKGRVNAIDTICTHSFPVEGDCATELVCRADLMLRAAGWLQEGEHLVVRSKNKWELHAANATEPLSEGL